VAADCVVDDHARHRFAVFFLLGRIDAVSFRVYGKAVDGVLHRKILELAIVVWVVLLENGNRPLEDLVQDVRDS